MTLSNYCSSKAITKYMHILYVMVFEELLLDNWGVYRGLVDVGMYTYYDK